MNSAPARGTRVEPIFGGGRIASAAALLAALVLLLPSAGARAQRIDTNLGVGLALGASRPGMARGPIAVDEPAQGGRDRNGDGNSDDLVVHATDVVDADRDGIFDFADACIGSCAP